jgi:excisionase family DNA binding protein
MADGAVLTVKEVAERLRIHPVTVRLWLKDGRLRGVRIGGTKTGWRIPASEVDRILAGRPVQDAEEEGKAEAA